MQLREELRTKLGIEAMDVNGLATTGVALRNRFWELGGCLSDIAYPYFMRPGCCGECPSARPENEQSSTSLSSRSAYEVFCYEERSLRAGILCMGSCLPASSTSTEGQGDQDMCRPGRTSYVLRSHLPLAKDDALT
jgi:hypothetical protein